MRKPVFVALVYMAAPAPTSSCPKRCFSGPARQDRLALLQGLMDTDGTAGLNGSLGHPASTWSGAWPVWYGPWRTGDEIVPLRRQLTSITSASR